MQVTAKKSWFSWLPKGAVVMARKGVAHSVETEQSASKVSLVVVTDAWSTQDPQAKPLLGRMLQAMGLAAEQVLVLEAALETADESAQDNINDSVLRAQILASGASVVVTLGAHATQVALDSLKSESEPLREIKVMPTLDLQTLLNHPASKKEAWADLQKVMKQIASIN